MGSIVGCPCISRGSAPAPACFVCFTGSPTIETSEHTKERPMTATAPAEPLFAGFEHRRIDVGDGVQINAAIGGNGPPLLLLHGHPQTHSIWHRVAPALATQHSLVLADLRGYGD